MKKTLLGLAVSTFFVVGAAQAAIVANDASAILTVTGNVTDSQTVCAVSLDQSAITLNGDTSNMATQGATAISTTTVDLSITGDEKCNTLVSQGKMAYKLLGTADTLEGNVLANAATGADAATGVGIGLYTLAGDVLAVNQSTLAASVTGTKFGLGIVKLNGQTPAAGKVQGALTIEIVRL